MTGKRKWLFYSMLAVLVVVIAVFGRKEPSDSVEAAAYVPQPLIVLSGDQIIYNDAPDCH